MPTRFSWIVAGIVLFPALVESSTILPKISNIPPGFEQNRGQAPAAVRYLVRDFNNGSGLYLAAGFMRFFPTQMGFRFIGANAYATESFSETLPGVVNVLRGAGPAAWHTGIQRFARVEFQQIYAGISVIYAVREKRIVCRVTLEPGANLSSVTLEALGVEHADTGPDNMLRLWFSREVAYSLGGLSGYVFDETGPVPVAARFRVTDGNRFQFELASNGDSLRRELEFNVLSISEDLSFKDHASGPSGSLYLAGSLDAVGVSDSALGDGTNPALEICRWISPMPEACLDAWAAKYNASGNLAWISYFHGNRSEQIEQVRLDSQENVFVAGGTDSFDFPVTPGALQTAYAGPTPPFEDLVSSGQPAGDMFLTKLSSADGLPAFSTFLGGPEPEWVSRLRVNANGNAYVFGPAKPGTPVTSAAMRGTPSCTQCTLDYVAKVDPSGTRLIFATYLAATPMTADLDAAGSVYFAGTAQAGEIRASTNAYQSTASAQGDGFVAKITTDGTAIEYATYIGGSNHEYVHAIFADSQGNSWIALVTTQTSGGAVWRLLKFDASVSRILIDIPWSAVPMALDVNNNLWIRAWPPTVLSTTADALLTKDAGNGQFARISPDGAVPFASYCPASMDLLGPDATGVPLMKTRTAIGTLVLTPPPPPAIDGILSSASWDGAYIAPGELVSVFGNGLGSPVGALPARQPDGRIATTLAGTRVLFDGVPAPLLYAQAGQVNAIVPFDVATSAQVTVEVEYQGQTAATTKVPSAPSAFSFFALDGTGRGQAAALNEDGTLNSPSNPAQRGSVVALWGTGAGQTTPTSADGAVTGGDPTMFEATATVGLTPATVLFAGAAPGMVAGVNQVNIRIPSGYSDTRFPVTALPVIVTIGGRSSSSLATIAVK